MNDFDARARSAARAVHHLVASGDDSGAAPAVDTVAVPPRKRHTMRALLAAAAVVLVAAIVGGVIVTNKDDGPTAAEVTAFCDAVTSAMGGDAAVFDRKMVDLAPDELRADAAEIAENGKVSDNRNPERLAQLEESGSRVLAWIETNCYPTAAQAGAAPADQRFAPLSLPDGTRPCFVMNGPPVQNLDLPSPGHATVFGVAGADDPWSGPLLALLEGTAAETLVTTGAQVEAGPAGGESGPLVDPSDTPIPGSATFTWTRAGDDARLALVARNGASLDLAAVASRIDAGGVSDIPADALPAGMTRIYDGTLSPTAGSVYGGGAGTTFSVTAGTDPTATGGDPFSNGGAIWSGQLGGQDAVDATRLLLGTSEQRTIGGRSALLWDTGNVEGSAVTARWAEPGGVVLSATTAGADRSTVERKLTELVGSMRKLDRDQWTDLTKQFSYCGALSTLGRSESSGSASAEAESGPITTSPTTAVAPEPASTTTVTGPAAP